MRAQLGRAVKGLFLASINIICRYIMMSLPLLGALRSLAVLLASVDRGAAAVKLKRMMATPRNAQQLEAML